MEQALEVPISLHSAEITTFADLVSSAKETADVTDPRGVTGCCQDCACEDSQCPQN
jgi:hypothetical protein